MPQLLQPQEAEASPANLPAVPGPRVLSTCQGLNRGSSYSHGQGLNGDNSYSHGHSLGRSPLSCTDPAGPGTGSRPETGSSTAKQPRVQHQVQTQAFRTAAAAGGGGYGGYDGAAASSSMGEWHARLQHPGGASAPRFLAARSRAGAAPCDATAGGGSDGSGLMALAAAAAGGSLDPGGSGLMALAAAAAAAGADPAATATATAREGAAASAPLSWSFPRSSSGSQPHPHSGLGPRAAPAHPHSGLGPRAAPARAACQGAASDCWRGQPSTSVDRGLRDLDLELGGRLAPVAVGGDRGGGGADRRGWVGSGGSSAGVDRSGSGFGSAHGFLTVRLPSPHSSSLTRLQGGHGAQQDAGLGAPPGSGSGSGSGFRATPTPATPPPAPAAMIRRRLSAEFADSNPRPAPPTHQPSATDYGQPPTNRPTDHGQPLTNRPTDHGQPPTNRRHPPEAACDGSSVLGGRECQQEHSSGESEMLAASTVSSHSEGSSSGYGSGCSRRVGVGGEGEHGAAGRWGGKEEEEEEIGALPSHRLSIGRCKRGRAAVLGRDQTGGHEPAYLSGSGFGSGSGSGPGFGLDKPPPQQTCVAAFQLLANIIKLGAQQP